MPDRYFVRISASTKRALVDLQTFGLDLFQATSRQHEDKFEVEGLITMEDVERLVRSGYQVLVQEESSRRARARDVIGFEEWIKQREKAR